jgi:hypothetical protein
VNEEYCSVELLGVDPIEQPSDFVIFAQCRPRGFEVVVAFLVYRNALGPIELVLLSSVECFHKSSVCLIVQVLVL